MEPQDDAKSFDQLDDEQKSIFLEAAKRCGIDELITQLPPDRQEKIAAGVTKMNASREQSKNGG